MWIIRAEFGQNIGQIGAFFKYLRALRQSPPFRTFSGSTRFFSKGKRHYRCANTVQAPIADIAAFHGASPERRIRPFITRPVGSEEHTSELQSLMRISYAVFCLKKKKQTQNPTTTNK